MASARTQPHPALELSSLWRSYRSAVTDPRLSEDCVFHLNHFIDVEWFTGRGERWQRGFWLSVDDSDVVHRVVAVSCYGLDSMPYNGSAINRLNYTNLDYKRGYIHEFILGAIFPFINSFFCVFLASIGIV